MPYWRRELELTQIVVKESQPFHHAAYDSFSSMAASHPIGSEERCTAQAGVRASTLLDAEESTPASSFSSMGSSFKALTKFE